MSFLVFCLARAQAPSEISVVMRQTGRSATSRSGVHDAAARGRRPGAARQRAADDPVRASHRLGEVPPQMPPQMPPQLAQAVDRSGDGPAWSATAHFPPRRCRRPRATIMRRARGCHAGDSRNARNACPDMPTRIADLHIAAEELLPSPSELRLAVPAGEEQAQFVARSRDAVRDIVHGRDDRLMVVTGPCSIHDTAAALEYAARLRDATASVGDALLPVMRVYFEKPRTRLGWKGMIYDPDLDGRGDIHKGLLGARKLLVECARLGVPAASEILDLVTPQYYAELLSWGAIGARTTESPLHRQMASALSAPLGFKNPTSGKLQTAVDAIVVAAQSHRFPSISLEGRAIVVTTTGNPDCHLILRGGESGPNHDAASVEAAVAALRSAQLTARVMIDCSHANSGGDFRRQPQVAADVAAQIASGSRHILGVMLESHLVEGRQTLAGDPAALRYGQSITDGCIGWQATVDLLGQLADAVRAGRRAAGLARRGEPA
jgi:3-deoxy-7-phosphoheptulonate synthase